MTDHEFGKFRSYVWPVHQSELKKLLPMLIMVFLTALIYEILRSIKESQIVTAVGSGAEVLPFLKVWAMLPIAILMTTLFVKLSHRFRAEKVFYILISGFLLFFLTFAFILYPMRESLHAHELANWLQSFLPRGAAGLVSMVRYWSFALFYAMAEVWGTICLTILFWGFANEITSVKEAGRFYGILCLGSNAAAIVAGQISRIMSKHTYNPFWIIGENTWHQSLILLTVSIAVIGALLLIIFRWFNQRVVNTLDLPDGHHNKKLDKLESKRSFKDSFSYLTKSKYLMSITGIVLSYNIFINLVEVLWKSKVKMAYSDPNDYTAFMANITSYTGIIACIMAVVISGNMIRRAGWTKTAMLTPLILVVTSVAFFVCYFFPEHKIVLLLGASPVVMIGAIQNSFSRAAKYTIFDETKEMCFIPLPRNTRVKGKAAIDGVVSRLGKSGGSLFYQGLFMFVGELAACAPYVAGVLVFVFTGWMTAVGRLGKMFTAAVENESAPEEVPEQLETI